MSSLAIITARGGSKRIPKKNIKDFCGKPIIAYSIVAALESGVFDEVMVSTDSQEIKEVAESYGASVPFMRSTATSNDYATTADVLEEVLASYEKIGKHFDVFSCIYPTAPFVTGKRLAEAYAKLTETDADTILSIVQYSFPPQRAFVIRDDSAQYQYPQFERTRSQDLEPIYHDCGQFYICKTKSFLGQRSLILPKTIPYILPEEEVQDIDTLADWKIAEAKYKVLHEGE